jgi:hypothetical protein
MANLYMVIPEQRLFVAKVETGDHVSIEDLWDEYDITISNLIGEIDIDLELEREED